MLGEMGQEGDHVVLGHRLDLVDAGDVELDVLRLPDRRGGRLRDHPERGLGVGGMRLDLEPDAEPASPATRSRPSRGGSSAGSSGGLSRLRGSRASDRLRAGCGTSEARHAAPGLRRRLATSSATIEDVRAGRTGRFTGAARFAPAPDGLAYREEGTLALRRRAADARRAARYLWRDGGAGTIEVLLRGRPLLPPLLRRRAGAGGRARLPARPLPRALRLRAAGRAGGRSGGSRGRARTTAWSAAYRPAERGMRRGVAARRCSRSRACAAPPAGAGAATATGFCRQMRACLADPEQAGLHRGRPRARLRRHQGRRPGEALRLADRARPRGHRHRGARRVFAPPVADFWRYGWEVGRRAGARRRPRTRPRDQLEGRPQPEPAAHPHLLRAARGPRRRSPARADRPGLGGGSRSSRFGGQPTTSARSPRSTRARSCCCASSRAPAPTWAASRSR